MLLHRLFNCWMPIGLKSQRRNAIHNSMRRTGYARQTSHAVRFVESFETRALLATTVLSVTNTLDAGAGSLRQAIEDANQSASPVRIEFAIPGSDSGFVDVDSKLSVTGSDAAADVFRLTPQSELSHLNNVNGQPVTIDARTQTTFSGNTNPNGPEVELVGTVGISSSGLFIESAGVEIYGLAINNFEGVGVLLRGSKAIVAGNYIGTDATGTLSRSNHAGVAIESGSDILIGGNTPASRNVISGNRGNGVRVDAPVSDVTINSNYIGLNAAGKAAVPNGSEGEDSHGIRLNGGGTRIRIGAAGAGNVISGNLFRGIGDLGVDGLIVQGNLIGTDSTGTVAIGNASDGIGFNNASHVLIGGPNPGEGNVIVNNKSVGIGIQGTDITIQGNRIENNALDGISLNNASHVLIGGPNPGEGNVIANNAGVGIGIQGTDITIQGNHIENNSVRGVAVYDSKDVVIAANLISGNGLGDDLYVGGGIELGNVDNVDIVNNLIGTESNGNAPNSNGNSGLYGNVVSNLRIRDNVITSSVTGVTIETYSFDGTKSHDVTLTGNKIGVSADGKVILGNRDSGILVLAVEDVTIGGLGAGEGNVISGNSGRGLNILNADRVQVLGNRIGTDDTGLLSAGNATEGVYVDATRDVEIRSNIIAFNEGTGVLIATGNGTTVHSERVRITENSIHSNGARSEHPENAIGIDIEGGGVNPNDATDADGDSNNRQNFPVISDATVAAQVLTVTYSVPTAPANATYPLRVEFFSADSDPNAPEGKTFLGADTFTATDFAVGMKTVSLMAQSPIGGVIVATATDAEGNTSEFSAGAPIETVTLTLPEVGGPFTLTMTNGELHALRADQSDLIAPQALSTFGADLVINGSAAADSVLLDASLDSIFQIVRFNAGDGFDQLDAHAMTHGVSMDGGAGRDTFIGGGGDDLFQGGFDNDSADGNGGRDTLLGDAGNDSLNGGDGNDLIRGAAGSDVLAGGDGADSLYGQGAVDTLDGGTGVDLLDGGTSATAIIDDFAGSLTVTNTGFATATGKVVAESISYLTLTGSAGADSLNLSAFSSGFAVVSGGDGDDTLTGSALRDVIDGGNGNDVINADAGNDLISGGGGNDNLQGGLGTDVINGGDGNDTGVGGGGDDSINGNVGDDILRGNSGNDSMSDGSGNDSLYGSDGDDQLQGGVGDDRLDGEAGNDRAIEQADANFTVTGQTVTSTQTGTDTGRNLESIVLTGGVSANKLDARLASVSVNLIGDLGSDTLLGGSINDTLRGGSGNDVLSGSAGNDLIEGGAGIDVLYESINVDATINGIAVTATGLGTDTVATIEGIVLIGGMAANTFNASASSVAVTLLGGNGNDTLVGSSKADVLIGGNRADSTAGTDSITGGTGVDTLDNDPNDVHVGTGDNVVANVFAALPSWIDAL